MQKPDKRHLKQFSVTNFKRFSKFEISELGNFNLIIGDNNVGKTSLLEALLFDEDGLKFSNNLLAALWFRNLGNRLRDGHISYFLNRKVALEKRLVSAQFKATYYNDFKSEFELQYDSALKDFKWSDAKGKLTFSDKPHFDFTSLNGELEHHIPFVPFYIGHDRDLTDFYSQYVQSDKRKKAALIETLKALIPKVENIEVSTVTDTPIIAIAQSETDAVMPLGVFGEGAIKFFRLLLEIIVHKGNRLMIDEVEASIHYSRYRDFWKALIVTAFNNDVQLFATTHNKECVDAFVSLLNEPDMLEYKTKARMYELVETKNEPIALSKQI